MADDVTTGRWRFVDASDISAGPVDFEGLDVRANDNEALGNVEGFIVDEDHRRLHYVVIDSGGWFGGGSYLIPPAYTRLDADARVLWADVTRQTIERFPPFDRRQYPTLSDDQIWQMERTIISAYGDDPGVIAPRADWNREGWPGYAQPGWWQTEFVAESAEPYFTSAGELDDPAAVGHATTGPIDAAAPLDERQPPPAVRDADPGGTGTRTLDPAIARAQPGDVLGIERGGETTSLGDTAEDEDRRRERAEGAAEDIARAEAADTAQAARDHQSRT